MEIWNVGAEVGECPFWDELTQTLYWIDVRNPALHRHDDKGSHLGSWPLPSPVGAFALLADEPSAIVALSTGLALLDLPDGSLTALFDPEPHRPENRLNEGKVSPCGKWFVFGSMHDTDPTQPSGGLYALSHSGQINQLASGLRVANGVAWSPDGRLLYFSDSREPAIWVCDWDGDAGIISGQRTFATPDETVGRPDGASMDVDGYYWSAGVSAACLNRFSPSGVLVESVPLPVQAPTMPAFDNREPTSLLVTSHRRCRSPTEVDGSIVKIPVLVRGTVQQRFRADKSTLGITTPHPRGSYS
ncbi:MAG TPA: SMP-30/gluconolactonase/LRE family protein [Ramlibacter sp.]